MTAKITHEHMRAKRQATCQLVYSEDEDTELFRLPANSRILGWTFNTDVAFDGSAPTVDIGILTDIDYFIDGLDIKALGQKSPTTEAMHPAYKTTRVLGIYGKIIPDSSTVGSVWVTCEFDQFESPLL